MSCSLLIRGDTQLDSKARETPGSVLSFSLVATMFSGVGVDSGLNTGWLIQSDQCLQLHIFQWDQSQTPVTTWATQLIGAVGTRGSFLRFIYARELLAIEQ